MFLDEKRNVHKEFVPVIKKPLVRWVDHTMYSTILNYAKKIDIHHNVVYSLQKCTGDLVDVSIISYQPLLKSSESQTHI